MRHKNILYQQEQNIIINKLLDFLELDNENSIILYELDNNQDKINNILSLLPEIKKFFSLSTIKGIREPNDTKRPYLSTIKNVLKDDYYIYNTSIRINKIKTVKYIFIKKNLI